MRLPAERPREALLRDEALLSVESGSQARWWVPASPALVLGVGMRQRTAQLIDLARAERAGVDVLHRSAGGGVVLLDEHMVCGAVCVPLPDARVGDDLTASYRWLGECLIEQLQRYKLGAHRVEVSEARASIAELRSREDAAARLLLAACYGALSPHEVALGQAKLIGLAQVRKRHAALFQIGILLRDQSALADYLITPDESTREQVRAELERRTVGLQALTGRSACEVAAAIAGATPCVT